MGACHTNQRPSLNLQNDKMICHECNYEFEQNITLSKQSTGDLNYSQQNCEERHCKNVLMSPKKRLKHSNSNSQYNSRILENETENTSQSDIQNIKSKFDKAYEQHFLNIHMALYDGDQNIFYCKYIMICKFAHKNYKEVEQHVMNEHLSKKTKVHHKKFLSQIKSGQIGLNRDGKEGFFCTKCQIKFKSKKEHDRVTRDQKNPCFSFSEIDDQQQLQILVQNQEQQQKQQKQQQQQQQNSQFIQGDSIDSDDLEDFNEFRNKVKNFKYVHPSISCSNVTVEGEVLNNSNNIQEQN